MWTRTLAAMLTLAAGTAAMGQALQWTKRVDDGTNPGVANTEVALAVDRGGTDVMVAWMRWESSFNIKVYYNVSTDGVNFRSDPSAVPLPSPLPSGGGILGADPMVAFASDGTGWVGYVQTSQIPPLPQEIWRDRFWIAKKDVLEPYADDADGLVLGNGPNGFIVDKGVLAVGPRTSGSSELMSLVYARDPDANDYFLRGTRSPDFATWSSDFPVGETTGGNDGGPNRVLILRNGNNTGRWVVGHHPDGRGLPLATYSDDEGDNWLNSEPPTMAPKPSAPSQMEMITNVANNTLQIIQPGMVRSTLNSPDLAADPNDEDTIYMIFAGHTLDTGGTSNADLFIARSTDGSVDFSGSPAGNNVLHLTDADLGVPADESPTHQFQPAITVDHGGGLNIMYYSARKNALTAIWEYQVHYARIPQWSNSHPSGIETFPLAGTFDMENIAQANYESFGHYMLGDSRTCQVYFPFVSRHENPTGVPGVYVSYINLCVDADVNFDGALTTADVDLFANSFAASDPRADLNGDEVFTTEDVNRFNTSYACGCNP